MRIAHPQRPEIPYVWKISIQSPSTDPGGFKKVVENDQGF